mgnify:CR=1 FL=1
MLALDGGGTRAFVFERCASGMVSAMADARRVSAKIQTDMAAARLEILPHLDSGSPPLSDLWDVEEDRDDPDMLAVERMRRPAAALGPNWLAIMTGRAQEDGVAGW